MLNDPNGLTHRLARFATGTRYEDLPSSVVHESKRLLLDTIGCAFGAINTASGRIARDYARALGGTPTATVIGLDTANSAPTAAYVNARLANVLDADDTFPTSSHFGNSTIFAALALAEHFDRNGRDLIKAIAVGFDVGARIGCWMGWPVQFKDGRVTGFNKLAGPAATTVWAAVGSAVSISGIDTVRACSAFGIAGANSPLPTVHKFGELVDVPMYKYADTGWCAQVGVSATLLASLGSTGFAGILDGENAFWRFYGSPGHDDEALIGGLGSEWQILNTTYKPWPCCRFIHYPLTAFEMLKKRHQLRPQEIERIVVRACPFALTPIFHERHPSNPLSAQFSHAHALAAAAYEIPAGPLWYTPEALVAAHIRGLRERIEVIPEVTSGEGIARSMQGAQWRGVPGGVDIYARGEVFCATVDMARGDPWTSETLLSSADLVSKFRIMVGLNPADGTGATGVQEAAEQVISAIEDIENLDIARLTKPLGLLAGALASETYDTFTGTFKPEGTHNVQ
jgi:2-methylcitrate dehydratase PrpD